MPSIREIAAEVGLSKSRVGELKAEGMPTHSMAAAKNWIKRHDLKREATNGGGRGSTASLQSKTTAPAFTPAKPADTGDSLMDVLQDCITVHKAAFMAYQFAASQGLNSTSARLSEFNKAAQNRLEAEKAYREELERRGVLVLKTDITERCKRSIEAIVRLIKKQPGELGPQCNETDPMKAVKILQRAADEVLKAGSQALRGL